MATRGNKQDHETKLLDILTKLEKAGYRASERKFKFFMNRTKWLGHEVDEKGIKPNEEKLEAIFKLNPPENTKKTKIISRSNTKYGKISTEIFGTNRPTEKTFEEKRTM